MLMCSIACPGRNFAIAELCVLAARLIQTFDFAKVSVTERLKFSDSDFCIRGAAVPIKVEIIDLDGQVKEIIHPGNKSDRGLPGMTAANIPMHDLACKLTPRHLET